MRPLTWICLSTSAAAHLLLLQLWLGGAAKLFAARAAAEPATVTEVTFATSDPLTPAPQHGGLPPLSPKDGPSADDAASPWREPGTTDRPRLEAGGSEATPSLPTGAAATPSPTGANPIGDRPTHAEPATSPTPTPIRQPTRTGPKGLGLPARIFRGKPSADLVIDPRDASFLARTEALGMRVIVFEDPSAAVPFYLELSGPGLEQVERQNGLDFERYSRRARDLGGVPAFDQLRERVAQRYGLPTQRTRMAAVVPNNVEMLFRIEEQRALTATHKTVDEVLALFGSLTDTAEKPLSITHALLSSGELIEVPVT